MMINRHCRLRGRVRLAVREGDRIVRQFPWQDNLILDQGLDLVATTLFNQLFIACAIGTGSNPTSRDPGANGTVSGDVITTNIAVFGTGDLDGDVVFDTGPRYKIQSITDPQHAVLYTSGTLTIPTHFTIEYTNQATLAGEVKRTESCVTTPGACGATVSHNEIVLQRTFLFTPESTEITYQEVGFSNIGTAGPNLFSRIVFGTPITLLPPSAELPTGQQLQVAYQLIVAFDYGQGPGIGSKSFLNGGRTKTTLSITNLPVQWSIWQYANSSTKPSNLAVSMTGANPALVGEQVLITGSSVAGYNGSWEVLDSAQFTDPTHGLSTVLSLLVPYTTSASGGILSVPLNASFYRACQGIWLIGSSGQSAAPTPVADAWFGYGEPSVTGHAWVSTAGGSDVSGGNNKPSRIDPSLYYDINTIPQPYASLNFYLDQRGDVVIGDNPNILSFGYGLPDSTNQIETWVFDQPHALVTNATLSLIFRLSWGRL